jgi:hypothetical protein
LRWSQKGEVRADCGEERWTVWREESERKGKGKKKRSDLLLKEGERRVNVEGYIGEYENALKNI